MFPHEGSLEASCQLGQVMKHAVVPLIRAHITCPQHICSEIRPSRELASCCAMCMIWSRAQPYVQTLVASMALCLVPSTFSNLHQELMDDPVMAADGFTYERAAIVDWLARGNASSPMTGAALGDTALMPNLAVRSTAAVAKRRRG